MFDKNEYLEYLGFSETPDASLATLREIHRKHQIRIPYDSGYCLDKDNPDFDLDAQFETIVLSGRGGICVELNFLFSRLLVELGFDVQVLSASTLFPGGEWGPDIEHMVMRVTIDGEDWLADTGHAGISIMEPLPFSGKTLVQNGIEFRLTRRGEYYVLDYKTLGKDWRDIYRFLPLTRTTADWAGWRDALIAELQGEPRPRRRRRVIDNGQVMLTENLFVSVEDGHERLRLSRDENELEKVVNTYWG
ncbi:arylamine N-acetyltransferase family protein [Frankia sp. Cas3]|uniref:arylamine N-acetyltransferase family protein n=1 Tax=Frankia sp. Cas3 TaxID=3073926 RepID=UPI002AD48700|nr:arylamine N-acetyltransferase [Frankia sp. Cas3]